MKNTKTAIRILMAFALTGLLLISSCGKKENTNLTNNCGIDATSIKATVNGGAFSNQTLSLVASTQCLLLYSSKTDTLCVVNSSGLTSQNSTTQLHILIEFFGNTTGTCTMVTASGMAGIGNAYVQLDITTASGNTTLYSQSGTVNVTALGASGDKISASFSGTFTDANGGTYTVTNGFASGIRT